ncbi:unnamed protein product [Soboliphyme baturini]|uniref:Secreted protein n=1 Tax=Soboliphyme baturini TaxID=241478 RepID=A0A183J4R0_9BILA|nr:unnamed protein product [Soboliphyme baturini]
MLALILLPFPGGVSYDRRNLENCFKWKWGECEQLDEGDCGNGIIRGVRFAKPGRVCYPMVRYDTCFVSCRVNYGPNSLVVFHHPSSVTLMSETVTAKVKARCGRVSRMCRSSE